MQDNPTLREVAQTFSAWLTAQAQAGKAWLSSLGEIRVDTIGTIIVLGCAVFCGAALLIWLAELSQLAEHYHTLGHSWLRAIRLAQADIEAARVARQRKRNPYYQGQPSRLAATPANREAWAQELEEQRGLCS
jgi:hypothetical protein